jgi:hypothetical protein
MIREGLMQKTRGRDIQKAILTTHSQLFWITEPHPADVDVRDIAKGIARAAAWDKEISRARSRRDWKKQIVLSLDPKRAQEFRLSSRPKDSDVCTMCGKFCSIKTMETCL